MNRLIAKIFYSVPLSFFLVEKNISSTGFVFTILSSFNLATASAILFPINSHVASAALWTMFLEAVFKVSNPISNNCFLYYLANDKNSYHLTYFPVLSSIYLLLFINKQCQINLVFFF